ncbi:MAG: homoserine dehydrogenase [Planctomycetota bacterium]|jgi:homoserine dehydrogenase
MVLKFGGSVLGNDEDLARATHEVIRWRRQGYAVLCVVSALSGSTDERLAHVQSFGTEADPHACARFVGLGELECAARFALNLDSAGVAATVLGPDALGLVADGPPQSATPKYLDRGAIQRAQAEDRTIVVPGFVAQDAQARPVLLGRGGSDLSAFFLAHELGADCRLIKDVDGLFESDPAVPGANPKRYSEASWEDALATDGSIVQHRALAYAQKRQLAFELTGLLGKHPTRIGPFVTRSEPIFETAPPLRVALLGFGTVGAAVYQELVRFPERFAVEHVAVRRRKAARAGIDAGLLSYDALATACTGVDLVIDTLGDTALAKDCLQAALQSGSHIITADKALIARAGPDLRALANTHHRSLACSAAVGGAMPLLERLALHAAGPVTIRAILNGTANYVLDALDQGQDFQAALRQAQHKGYAESDPSRDLDGTDAAHKLSVLSQSLGWGALDPARIVRAGIDEHTPAGLRQVAQLQLTSAGPEARVLLELLPEHDPLGGLPGTWNAATWQSPGGERHYLSGKGAGGAPTASAILSDALALRVPSNSGFVVEQPLLALHASRVAGKRPVRADYAVAREHER